MNEWKKVADELPPTDTLLLFCGAKGGMFIGIGYGHPLNGSIYASVPNARSGRWATHWIELPKPPKV